MPGFRCGRPPRNRGWRYPADPPPVEEVVAVMRAAGDSPHGLRTRALIVVLWRAGLRMSEALALAESDLDRERGAILVRRGRVTAGVRAPLAGPRQKRTSDSVQRTTKASPQRKNKKKPM